MMSMVRIELGRQHSLAAFSVALPTLARVSSEWETLNRPP